MSQPVGPEYGLEPRQVFPALIVPIDSEELVSQTPYTIGTEFGGVDGLIQPPPHVPTASERLSMIYAIDPMDDGTRGDSVLPPELEGEFN